MWNICGLSRCVYSIKDTLTANHKLMTVFMTAPAELDICEIRNRVKIKYGLIRASEADVYSRDSPTFDGFKHLG